MPSDTQKIVIAADHRGFYMKEYLTALSVIGSYNIEWHDVGTHSIERTDYPFFSRLLVNQLQHDTQQLGIALCGTGIGMAIAANRVKSIYAGLVWNAEVARLAREDDNVNLLVLPSDFISNSDAYAAIEAWLSAAFKGGRYAERLRMIDDLF